MNAHGQGHSHHSLLAQRLNHLANAHNDGLINDEQYRNLRQAAFEQTSQPSNASRVTTSTRFPTEPQPQKPQHPSHNDTNRAEAIHVDAEPTQAPPRPLRSKSSFTSGLANLIRRPNSRRATSEPADAGTAKKSTAPTKPGPSNITSPPKPSNPAKELNSSGPTSPGGNHAPSSFKSKWTASLPRALTSKSSRSSLKSVNATTSATSGAEHASDRTRNPSVSSERTNPLYQFSMSSPPPLSATSTSTFASSPPTSPTGATTTNAAVSVIMSSAFLDTEDPHTSQALKEAIAALETEAKRLITSYNELERTKMAQARKKYEEAAVSGTQDGNGVLLSPVSPSSATLPYAYSQIPTQARPAAVQLVARRAASSSVSMMMLNSDTGSTRSLHTADHSVHSRTPSVLGRKRSESSASHTSTLSKASLSYASTPPTVVNVQIPSSPGSLSSPSTPSRPSFSSSITSSSMMHGSTAPSSVSSHGHPQGASLKKKSTASFLHLPRTNSSNSNPSHHLSKSSSPMQSTESLASSKQHPPKRRPSLLKSRSAGSLSAHLPPHASSLSALVEESVMHPAGSAPPKNGDVEAELDRLGEAGTEVREVRRQRAEVVKRAEERLAYLRARLKSAELHEKLLRR